MGKTFILGSRGSTLALAQTREVMESLQALYPQHRFSLQIIKTTGDRVADLPLPQIGVKGVFVKELQQALLAGEVHLAVHSYKDLPVESPPGLAIAAIPRRDDPRDVIVSRSGLPLSQLPSGARVGTSSPRRQAQLRALRPDLEYYNLRGNLDTRLRRVGEGIVEAAAVAAAGMKRLRWEARITEYLSPEVCIPAVGQGALAIEIREEDEETRALVAALDHRPTHRAITAEKAFLRHLGGGCHTPIAALGQIEDGTLRLWGMVASPDGSHLLKDKMEGNAEAPEEIGALLGETLLSLGAAKLLAEA